MEELVKLASQKTGIPEATAKTSVDTVISYLKTKLPAPIAGQLDSLLSDQAAADVLSKGLDMVKKRTIKA